MSPVLASAPALPLGHAGKFVAAAYIVFVVLILSYVAIMAVRAQRMERDLDQLQRDVEAARAHADRFSPGAEAADSSASTGDQARSGSLL